MNDSCVRRVRIGNFQEFGRQEYMTSIYGGYAQAYPGAGQYQAPSQPYTPQALSLPAFQQFQQPAYSTAGGGQATGKPGFFQKLGAVGKGLLDVPGKLVQGVVNTLKDPKKLLLTAGSVALCFTPLAPVAVPALIGYGLFKGVQGTVKGAGQMARGWANHDLHTIRDGSGNMGVGAASTALSALGARAHIRSQVAAGNLKPLTGQPGIQNNVTGVRTAPVTVRGRTILEGKTFRAGDAANVTTVDALRLIGREYAYGARQAANFAKGQFQAATSNANLGATTAARVSNYAKNTANTVNQSVRPGGVVSDGVRQTTQNFGQFRQTVARETAYKSSRAVQGYQGRLTRLQSELGRANPAQQATIQAKIDATRIGLERARANAVAGPRQPMPSPLTRQGAQHYATQARSAAEVFHTQNPGASAAIGGAALANQE